MIRSILGLTNLFRYHIPDNANIAAPLNPLLRKGGDHARGCPRNFLRIKRILCSAQIMTLPEADKQYALIVDDSTGAQDFVGGFGAILTLMGQNSRFSVITYASQLLSKAEKQISPFLLEMRAMVGPRTTSRTTCEDKNYSSSQTTNHFRPVQTFWPTKL